MNWICFVYSLFRFIFNQLIHHINDHNLSLVLKIKVSFFIRDATRENINKYSVFFFINIMTITLIM